MNKAKDLRKLINGEEILVLPGVFDALSAKIAEIVGFKAAAHSGFATAAVREGLPDIGLISFGEMIDQVRKISMSVSIPILADVDTGYGNAVNVYRTVKEFIFSGASGLFIEDQVWPKRCGHMFGKQIVSLSEMEEKLRAAFKARNEFGDIVIGARTDAIAVSGIEEAIKRGNRFAELGADFVFIEAPISKEQIEILPKRVKAPLLLNMVEGGKTPLMRAKEAQEMGFKIIAFPVLGLFTYAKSVMDAFRELKEKGSSEDLMNRVLSFDYFVDDVVNNKFYKLLADEVKGDGT